MPQPRSVPPIDSVFGSAASVSSNRVVGAGPIGHLPLTRRQLLDSPSGNLFGLTQNVGMGWSADALGGPEYVIVLVSEHFDGVPWLERVYVAGTLWDSYEMGAPADVHAYTQAEFERKRETLPAVRATAESGLELLPTNA